MLRVRRSLIIISNNITLLFLGGNKIQTSTITITEEFLELGKSEAGGWTAKKLALLGISWPPKKGWKSQLLGKKISASIAEKFTEGKKPESLPIQVLSPPYPLCHPIPADVILNPNEEAPF